MSHDWIHNARHLKEIRKELRNNATPAEAALWNYLKNKKLANHKFSRQHSIENYIVDFYCSSEKLIIELDGEIHQAPMNIINDKERDTRLHELGYKVLRFPNNDVLNNINQVLYQIQLCFENH
ncbi:MAG: endonuclease domain-containing protein [Bacteroidetes bacterium]|nr:endonuclease domain-containing protein [Bacteroidota bacterium]